MNIKTTGAIVLVHALFLAGISNGQDKNILEETQKKFGESKYPGKKKTKQEKFPGKEAGADAPGQEAPAQSNANIDAQRRFLKEKQQMSVKEGKENKTVENIITEGSIVVILTDESLDQRPAVVVKINSWNTPSKYGFDYQEYNRMLKNSGEKEEWPDLTVKTDYKTFQRISQGTLSEKQSYVAGLKKFLHPQTHARPKIEKQAHNLWAMSWTEEHKTTQLGLYEGDDYEEIKLDSFEEILRVFKIARDMDKPGYAGFFGEMALGKLPADKDDVEDYAESIKNILAGMGYTPAVRKLNGGLEIHGWYSQSQDGLLEDDKDMYLLSLSQKKMVKLDEGDAARHLAKFNAYDQQKQSRDNALGEAQMRINQNQNDRTDFQEKRAAYEDSKKSLLFSNDFGGRLK